MGEKLIKGEVGKVESLLEEVSNLKKQLDEKALEVSEFQRKAELIDVTRCDKEEKEKIVETLEADFKERQALHLTKLEEKLREEHRKELEALKESKNEEMLQRMEEMRQKMVDSTQLSVGRLKTRFEKEQNQKLVEKEVEMKAKFEVELTKLEDVKLMEIEEAKERVKKKSKMEMETLRSRFKIMQTTGTLERSPSVSESEFSIEGTKRMRSLSSSEAYKYRTKSPRLGSMEHLGNMEHRLEEM